MSLSPFDMKKLRPQRLSNLPKRACSGTGIHRQAGLAPGSKPSTTVLSHRGRWSESGPTVQAFQASLHGVFFLTSVQSAVH